MFKSLKSPEKLFHYSMWLVSLLFASFLVGLGGKVIADLPAASRSTSIDQFANPAAIAASQGDVAQAQAALLLLQPQLAESQAQVKSRRTAYETAQDANRNWLATRKVTASNPRAASQDPELMRQVKNLQELSVSFRDAQVALESVDYEVRAANRAVAQAQTTMDNERTLAGPKFQRSARQRELTVFGYRLALTLPLLAIAGWLVAKKRKSSHWPLARGFVIFAAFAFFVELVPYLPSYGGYVRYGVGIALSLVGGHYGINWMRAYLARRSAESKRNEEERRMALDEVLAVQKIAAKLCPGCERAVPAEVDGVKVNNCGYCGLKLFDFCGSTTADESVCGVRKNAFFHYCPSCGNPKKSIPSKTVNQHLAEGRSDNLQV